MSLPSEPLDFRTTITSSDVLSRVKELYATIRKINPLVVQLTNFVVANDQVSLCPPLTLSFGH